MRIIGPWTSTEASRVARTTRPFLAARIRAACVTNASGSSARAPARRAERYRYRAVLDSRSALQFADQRRLVTPGSADSSGASRGGSANIRSYRLIRETRYVSSWTEPSPSARARSIGAYQPRYRCREVTFSSSVSSAVTGHAPCWSTIRESWAQRTLLTRAASSGAATRPSRRSASQS